VLGVCFSDEEKTTDVCKDAHAVLLWSQYRSSDSVRVGTPVLCSALARDRSHLSILHLLLRVAFYSPARHTIAGSTDHGKVAQPCAATLPVEASAKPRRVAQPMALTYQPCLQ